MIQHTPIRVSQDPLIKSASKIIGSVITAIIATLTLEKVMAARKKRQSEISGESNDDFLRKAHKIVNGK